nr:CAP domain-containing protein [Deinococcus sp. RM]
MDLTNAARAVPRSCGATSYAAAAPLTWNAPLAQAAQGHATDMATQNYFSHTSKDGRTFSQRITTAGYTPYRTIGENIAAGQTTPQAVVDGWLKSEGHCRNIMNPAFKELGVGYAYAGTSTYKHYWVQDFGAR